MSPRVFDAALSGDQGGLRPEFVLRAGLPEDRNWIYASWLRSYMRSGFARGIPDVAYFRFHREVITRILARGASVAVCTPAESPETILGWSVTEPGVIHYVHVKQPFRLLGIALSLLPDPNACVFTHWTAPWNAMLKKFPNCEYNPYLI